MVSSHKSLAIAQTAFYIPAVPIALYIFIRNWKNGPKLGWWPLVPFSLSMIESHSFLLTLKMNANIVQKYGLLEGSSSLYFRRTKKTLV